MAVRRWSSKVLQPNTFFLTVNPVRSGSRLGRIG